MARKLVAAGCIHLPLHDEAKLSRLMQLVEDERPDDLVLMGDIIDVDFASNFDSTWDHDSKDEFDAMNGTLQEMRLLARSEKPACTLHVLLGNHEYRLEKNLPRKLRRTVSLDEQVSELKHWRVYPYQNDEKGVCRLGPVSITHGFKTGMHADSQEGVRFGMSYGLHIMAHTHNPTTAPRPACLPGVGAMKHWVANVGTLCDVRRFKDEGYAKGRNTDGWAAAPIVVEYNEARRAFCSRQWTATQHYWE